MPLSERSRAAIYQGFTTIVDDPEAVAEMLSYFPSRDVDESITKDFQRAENTILRAELRTEMAGVGSQLRTEMGELRTELMADMAVLGSQLRTEMGELRTELKADMAALGSELQTEMGELRTELKADVRAGQDVLHGEIRELRDDMHRGLRVQTQWTVGAMIALVTLVVAIQALLH